MFIAARDAQVAGALWAIETAMGVPVAVGDGAGAKAALHRRREMVPMGLCALAEGGYVTPLATAAGREVLAKSRLVVPEATWLGWRVSEMPLLYRNIVLEA